MFKKQIYLTFSFLLSSCFLYAQEEESTKNKGQLNIGVESNSQWYIDDDKIQISEIDAIERFRSNNYLKADYFINKWEFSLQLESYSPMALLNYAPEFRNTNVGTVFVAYNDTDLGLDVTAGHFYEQFGSGLALRAWEDRQLGINNAIFGGRIGYQIGESARLTVLGGRQRVGMGFDLSKSFLSGANLDVNLSDLIKLEDVDINVGASYVGRYEDLQDQYPELDKMTNVYSFRADMSKGNFYAGAEYVYKSKDALVEGQGALQTIMPEKLYDGKALLINLGYSKRGFGFDMNLRRIENIGMYSERGLNGNTFNMGGVNYVPALTKQYDYALQNIYVYQVAKNTTFSPYVKAGEIGGQFDLYYQFQKETVLGGKYGTNVAINGSFWNALQPNDVNLDSREVSTEFFDFGRKYYNDLAIEVRKKFSEKWQTIFMAMGQYYNQKYIEDTTGEHKAYVLGGEAIYRVTDTQSFRFIGQHLWADGDKKNWAALTLEYIPSLRWSFFFQDLYNYGNDHVEDRIHYYNVGGAFTKGATRISVSYGRQRGGMICVGGVCRWVPESSGLTVNISSNF